MTNVDVKVFAEDLPYWKTSGSSPSKWLEKARRCLEQAGGIIEAEFSGDQGGMAAFVLAFMLEGDQFKIIWPVAKPKKQGEEQAARRQSATMLYHDIKSRCVAVRIRGARTAFFADLCLPGGKTAAQVSAPHLLAHMPKVLTCTLASGV